MKGFLQSAAEAGAARVRFPWRVFSRIVMLQTFLMIAALGASALSARYFFKAQFIRQTERQLEAVLEVLADQTPPSTADPAVRTHWCAARALQTSYRIRWRAADGTELCRSDAEEPTGERITVSLPVPGAGAGSVLMGSTGLEGVHKTLHVFDAGLFLALLVVGLGLGAFSVFSSRQLVVPLGELILKARESVEGEAGGLPGSETGEWVELESALNRIQSDLRQKTEALSREREELATLMGAISDAILAVDAGGKPLFFNSRFALLFFDKDLRDKQPHLGEIFRTPDVLNAFHAALREGVVQKVSMPLYTRTESMPHYFSLSVAPLRREVGPVYGAVGIFHDVTELKRAENIRIEFVANVSHELRTPLTAIKGYTDTLREDVAQRQFDSAEAFLGIVARNVDRLMRLIGDLLDLSSLESNDSNGHVTRSPVDTRDLTARVLAQLEGRRADKLHTVETVFETPTVYAESARIEQVLINLLENAIKYIPNNGKIVVTWAHGKEAVLLRVSDNGPGIPAEHHSRLFERFYRIDPGRSRDMGGTGLGLAIVKHIMQRHGGLVWVNSEVGKGTEFVCQFPVS